MLARPDVDANVAVMTSAMTSAGDQRRVECVKARGEFDDADSSLVM